MNISSVIENTCTHFHRRKQNVSYLLQDDMKRSARLQITTTQCKGLAADINIHLWQK